MAKLTDSDSLRKWKELTEKVGGSTTAIYNYFLYVMTDEERDEMRQYLNLTHLLIWALAEQRGDAKGLWTKDYVTKRVLG
jgi:hypothetical protein